MGIISATAKRGEMLRLQRQARKEFASAAKMHVEGVSQIIHSFKAIDRCVTKKDKRKALKRASKPLIVAARAAAPQSKRPHTRLKGGRKITYMPGNLKKSIKVLPLRRANDKIFIGPKVSRRGGADTYGVGAKVDAYYAHWVEFGNANYTGRPYMRPALEQAGPAVKKRLREELKALVMNCAKRYRK